MSLRADPKKWRIYVRTPVARTVLIKAGRCLVLKPGDAAERTDRLVYQTDDENLIGLVQAYSTFGSMNGHRSPSKDTLDAQREHAAEVAARILARRGGA